MTVFSSAVIDFDSIAFATSSSLSKTRALPSKVRPSFPVIFETQPPVARLPRRMLHAIGVSSESRRQGI